MSLREHYPESVNYSPDDSFDPRDDELEQMLAQAERLANEMRNMSQKNLGAASGIGFPSTIQIQEKDKDSQCSSMEVNSFDPLQANEGDATSTSHNLKEIHEENETHVSEASKLKLDPPSPSMDSHVGSHTSGRMSSSADVDAIIQASQEMARTLAAMNFETTTPVGSPARAGDRDVSPDSHTTRSTPTPSAPTSVCDSKSTKPAGHLFDTSMPNTSLVVDTSPSKDSNVTWEKVDYTDEQDDDYVPIADYSKSSTPPKKKRDKNGIKWENVSTPTRADPDYSPLVDYSSPSPSSNRVNNNGINVQPSLPNFGSRSRATIRRLRKREKRVRIVGALLSLLVLVALAFWNKEVVSGWYSGGQELVYQFRLATYGPTAKEIAEAEALAAKAAAEEAARHAREKQAAAEAARVAAEEQAKAEAERRAAIQRAEEEEARKQAEEEQRLAAKAEEERLAIEEYQELCGRGITTLVSPVCREKHKEIAKIPNFQQLLQIVMT